MPPQRVAAAGESVVEQWSGEPSLADAGRVLLYAALPDELPTRPLYEYLRARGVEVLLPRCETHCLAFAPVGRWDELEVGRYGILEPPAGTVALSRLGSDTRIVVPGLAFDGAGNRLGQGGGWYDRTFASRDPSGLIGIGFALQVVDTVPAGSRDRGVGAILTESGFTRITRTA